MRVYIQKEKKNSMILDRNILEKNSEEILVSKLASFFGFLAYLSELSCVLNLYQISNESVTELKTTASKLINDFDFIHFNQSFILLKSKSRTQGQCDYVTSIRRVLVCLMSPNTSLAEEKFKVLKTNETQNQLDELLSNEEIQSFFYVIAILLLFTAIFASILILTHKFNRQDAELYESYNILF